MAEKNLSKRIEFMIRIGKELDRAYSKHGAARWGRHEFYAILKEEVDEVWDSIKADGDNDELEGEIIQVAAMCMRYLETGDRYRASRYLDPTLRPATPLAEGVETPVFVRKIMD